jgi:hypothetical protein
MTYVIWREENLWNASVLQRVHYSFPILFVSLVGLCGVFLGNVGNSLFNNVFQFLQASWVTRINSFFAKSPHKEVLRGKAWGSWWPKAMPNNALTKELLQ